jgi:VanZ family protein
MGAQDLGETTTQRRGAARNAWLWVFALLALAHLAALYWPRVTVEGPVAWTDKVVHVLLFALPAAAGLLAGLRPAYLLVPLALHAPLSEALQHFVLPNRSGDPWDALADLSGVVVGVTLAVVGGARLRW